MDEFGAFKHTLMRMLHDGTFQALLGPQDGRCAKLAFEFLREYHMHTTPRYIVLHARDVERVVYHPASRSVTRSPRILDRGYVIMDRTSGRLVESRHLGGVNTSSPSVPLGHGSPRPTSVNPVGRGSHRTH